MKKILMLLCVLACVTQAGICPPYPALKLFVSPPIYPYERIEKAIIQVESGGDTLAYNGREGAVGLYQIREIRLRDYNVRTKSDFTIKEMYEPAKAKKIFLYYATQFHHEQYKEIAKDWNKSKTNKYWEKVKKYL